MISFADGKNHIDEKNISAVIDYENMKLFCKNGLIEEREENDGRTYYYMEAVEDATRFGAFIRLREKKIEWVVLRWLDGPMKSWDDVSEKALSDEYRLLLRIVEQNVGRPPDKKKKQ